MVCCKHVFDTAKHSVVGSQFLVEAKIRVDIYNTILNTLFLFRHGMGDSCFWE